MKTFLQWLDENSLRTSLGIYPPLYGSGQYPPNYFTPISATAALSFQAIHKDLLKNSNKKKKSKKRKKKKQ